MRTILWMTIDRHPNSLRALIRDRLTATGWRVFEISYDSLEGMNELPLEEVDAVLLAPARYLPATVIKRLTACNIVQIWSSGYDKFNINDCHDRGIVVANNHGSNATSVAEQTMLLMLGLARRAPEMHNRVTTGVWAGNDHGMSSYSLAGKTLGIVGLGNIGSLVAERSAAFGMRIVFADPKPSKTPSPEWQKASFEELLGVSDFITLHLHLNTDTRNLINLDNLHLLTRKPFVINVSRAQLIQRQALDYALDSKQIRGVALDAHYDEPTSAGDSLMARDNVFFSPHVAGSTIDSYTDMVEACVRNIQRCFETGEVRGRIAP